MTSTTQTHGASHMHNSSRIGAFVDEQQWPTPVHSTAGYAATSSKNCVLCFDGTSNTFSSDLSNLPLLYGLLSADPSKQAIYYQSGIGTYTPGFSPTGLMSGISQLLDLAVAWDLGNHVQDGYKFLMNHYKPGDKIFLFGFSRGSYTARALAGMLQSVGLLLPGNDQSVSLAYQIYSKQQGQLLFPSGVTIAHGFKTSFSRDVRVHFVGCFDTVASVGAIIPRRLPFADGAYQIGTFRHALSLDERRARFYPQFWMKPKPGSEGITPPTDVLEIFFAGVHSNVGGGLAPTDGDITPRLSHITLHWMIREAFTHGLELDPAAVRSSNLFGTNPVYMQTVQNRLDKPDSMLAEWLDASLNPHRSPDDVVALVQIASRPSTYMRQDALAPRGDALSLRIKARKGGSFKERLSGWWTRVTNRAGACAWWILEVLPTLKIVWDDERQESHWRFRPNLGRGRLLPVSQSIKFHQSVQDRIQAGPKDFPTTDGDNVSIPETCYVPAARFPQGLSVADVEYVE